MFERFSREQNNEEQDQDRQHVRERDMTRREFLKTIGIVGAGTAAVLSGTDMLEYVLESDAGKLRHDGEKLDQNRKEVSVDDLAGRNVNGLYKLQVGLSTELDFSEPMTVPETFKVDFTEQLGALWKTKREWCKKQDKKVTPVAVKTGRQLIDEYGELTPNGVSADEYRDEIDRVTADLFDQLNWADIQQKFSLSDREGELLQNICHEVGGQELLSYAMTELIPSKNGEFNKDVLDFLLENAGREYVERIPAIYDEWTSFGPYQFTSKALFHTPGGQRGASQLADHAPDADVPGSVSKLRGTDHHQAAYLLAARNLVGLISRLDDESLATFEARWYEDMSEIAQFIATAHNYPYSTENFNGALKAGEYWIANDMERPFIDSCGSKTKSYAEKTAANYEALANPYS